MTMRIRHAALVLTATTLLTAALPTALAGSGAQASLSPMSLPTWAHDSISGAGPHNGVRLRLVAWPKQSALGKSASARR